MLKVWQCYVHATMYMLYQQNEVVEPPLASTIVCIVYRTGANVWMIDSTSTCYITNCFAVLLLHAFLSYTLVAVYSMLAGVVIELATGSGQWRLAKGVVVSDNGILYRVAGHLPCLLLGWCCQVAVIPSWE